MVPGHTREVSTTKARTAERQAGSGSESMETNLLNLQKGKTQARIPWLGDRGPWKNMIPWVSQKTSLVCPPRTCGHHQDRPPKNERLGPV